MKRRHKIVIGIAALGALTAGFMAGYFANKDVKPEPIAGYRQLKADAADLWAGHYNAAIETLTKQKNMENAYKADEVADHYFFTVCTATIDESESYRHIMWGSHFLNDAAACIDAYKKVGDNEDIGALVTRMEERIKLGQDIALSGSTEEIRRRINEMYVKSHGKAN